MRRMIVSAMLSMVIVLGTTGCGNNSNSEVRTEQGIQQANGSVEESVEPSEEKVEKEEEASVEPSEEIPANESEAPVVEEENNQDKEDKKKIDWKDHAYYIVNDDGSQTLYYEKLYDEYGNLRYVNSASSINIFKGDLLEAGEYKLVNEYAGEKLVRASVYPVGQEDQLLEYATYTYDEAGCMTEYNQYDAEDNLKYTTEYIYDSVGNVLSEKQYMISSVIGAALDNYFKYEYDDRGNRTKLSWLDRDGNVSSYATWKYDENDHMTEYYAYLNGSDVWSKGCRYTYDAEAKQWLGEAFNSDGIVNHTYVYDEDDNLLLEQLADDDGNMKTISQGTYTYDKNGYKYMDFDSDGHKICRIYIPFVIED